MSWRLTNAKLAAAAIAGLAGFKAGSLGPTATLERERTAWANERTKAADAHAKALDAEIQAHNAIRNELDANHANNETVRALLRADAASAVAARDAADRAGRRLLDAAATNRRATRAAVEAAGPPGLCKAALEAIDMRDQLLGRIEAATGRLRSAATGIGEYADAAASAASECAGWADAVIRNSAAVQP